MPTRSRLGGSYSIWVAAIAISQALYCRIVASKLRTCIEGQKFTSSYRSNTCALYAHTCASTKSSYVCACTRTYMYMYSRAYGGAEAAAGEGISALVDRWRQEQPSLALWEHRGRHHANQRETGKFVGCSPVHMYMIVCIHVQCSG